MIRKLVAVDADGTLLTQSQQIPARVLEAAKVAAEHDVAIVLNTGRNLSECVDFLRALPQIQYAVFCTGSQIMDLRTRKTLFRCGLTAEEARFLYFELRKFDGLINMFSDDQVYNRQEDVANLLKYYPPEMKSLFDNTHILLDHMDERMLSWDKPVEKFYVGFANMEETLKARAYMQQFDFYVTGAGYCDLEVMNKHTDKGVGLRHLAKLLDVPMSNIIAVGDSSNDSGMLRDAGVAIAVANAQDSLKEIADAICPSNEDGGVADVLLKAAQEGEISWQFRI